MAARRPAWASETTSLTPSSPRSVRVTQELGPEGLVLAVADVHTEDFAVAVSPHAGGDHHRFGDDLAGVADVDIGRVQPDVGKRLMVQPSLPQDGDVVVNELADPRYLGQGLVDAPIGWNVKSAKGIGAMRVPSASGWPMPPASLPGPPVFTKLRPDDPTSDAIR